MSGPKPTRDQGDLAEMLETVLDKGVVINADIAVSVGDTELLGVKLRAAVASFETAAEYGLEFPGGTDLERVRDAADVNEVPAVDGDGVADVVFDDENEEHGTDAAPTATPGTDADTDSGTEAQTQTDE